MSYLLRKSKKEPYWPNIISIVSLLCLKRNNSQTFKSSNCKKDFLQCNVIVAMLQVASMIFFIPCDNWKTLFLQKIIYTLRFLKPLCFCASWNRWFEISLYFIIYLHDKSTMLIRKWKVPKWSSHISYLFNFLSYF